MLSNKRGCPRRTNIGLVQVSIDPLDWSIDDTRKQICEEAKKAKWVAQNK